ncbi:MAG: hemolysin family protein [Candidatus Sumerlaeota bacterium]|nr:hemolysin family protein [Candidatus Sumerlaeota bacterium]
MGYILLISLLAVIITFWCSVAEACIFTVSRSHIEALRREGYKSGERLARMRTNIDEAIAAILILNTIAHTTGAAYASALVEQHYHNAVLGFFSGVLVFAALFTLSILIIGEIVPKSIGVKFANRLAPFFAYQLSWIIFFLKPLIIACVAITRLWGKESHLSHATEDDIISLASLSQRSGQIRPEEVKWVANALRLNDVTAFDLMTPNSVVARVPEPLPLRYTTVDAQHWRYSRVPVCRDDNPDAIVGVVYRRDVFDALAKDQFELTMGKLMEPVRFVPQDMPAHQLLDLFLSERRHLFCVQDAGKQFLGVVTLEDVLECLIGAEIVDEKDLHVNMQELARQRRQRLLRQSQEFIESHPE